VPNRRCAASAGARPEERDRRGDERAAGTARDRDEPDRAGFAAVEATLLAELDAGDHVRETSVVWGEVLASAVFEPDLREQLRAASDTWSAIVAERIRAGQSDGSVRADADPAASAERLRATVDGLSTRWPAGVMTRERARELLADAIASELRP
jgi:hypothetical protein